MNTTGSQKGRRDTPFAAPRPLGTPEPDDDSPLAHVNTYSRPSSLQIIDMRFAEIVGAPMRCILMKLYTNQEIVGYGELRDWGRKHYALMLKSRLLGQNPCDVDRIFRSIKQFGAHGRQWSWRHKARFMIRCDASNGKIPRLTA